MARLLVYFSLPVNVALFLSFVIYWQRVPLHAGIAFMLTAPIINPVVLFSTYVAFGSTWEVPLLRVAGSLVVALVVGNIIAYFYKGTGLKERF